MAKWIVSNSWPIVKNKMKALLQRNPNIYQLIRYITVGVMNNFLGYLIYLLITYFWLDPKLTVTLFYLIGALTGYFGHLKYSFAYEKQNKMTIVRYGIAHIIGYSINFMMLLILVDKFKFPHQIIQALAIFVVAGALFLMLRYFVFPHTHYRKD